MNATIKIPVSDIDSNFIEDLKTKYGEAELEINVRPAAHKEVLPESEFWKVIGLLDWDKTGDNAAVLKPAVTYLSELPISFIYQFQDKLSEKLYRLDTQVHAENSGRNAYHPDEHFSVDIFLYERCCVVANGKEYYKEVLRDPTKMIQDLTFEPLLHLASDAFKLKTGKALSYLPTFNYETFSNEAGWPE